MYVHRQRGCSLSCLPLLRHQSPSLHRRLAPHFCRRSEIIWVGIRKGVRVRMMLRIVLVFFIGRGGPHDLLPTLTSLNELCKSRCLFGSFNEGMLQEILRGRSLPRGGWVRNIVNKRELWVVTSFGSFFRQ